MDDDGAVQRAFVVAMVSPAHHRSGAEPVAAASRPGLLRATKRKTHPRQQGLPALLNEEVRDVADRSKVASTTARRGCLPRRPPVFTGGRDGSMTAHCASLVSDGYCRGRSSIWPRCISHVKIIQRRRTCSNTLSGPTNARDTGTVRT